MTELAAANPDILESTQDMPLMLIGVCTHQRHRQLDRLLASLSVLKLPKHHRIALLIVENDAAITVDKIVKNHSFPFPVNIILAPDLGLSNARNALLDAADEYGAVYFLGVDDDEIVVPGWARAFEVGFERLQHASALMGWVDYAFEGQKSGFMTPQDYGRETFGKRRKVLSTTNYALRRAVFGTDDGLGLRFNAKLNFTRGEDTDFFQKLEESLGHYTATVPQALSTEYVTEDRATLSAMLKRVWVQHVEYLRIYCNANRTKSGGLTLRTYRNVWRTTLLWLSELIGQIAFVFHGGKPFLVRVQQNIGLILSGFVRIAAVFGFLFGVRTNSYAVAPDQRVPNVD